MIVYSASLEVEFMLKEDKNMLTEKDVMQVLTELVKELNGKLINSNGNIVLFSTNRDDFLLEPQSFLNEKELFEYTDRKEFEDMSLHTSSLDSDLSMSADELKEELSNTIKLLYEKMIPENSEKQLNEKLEDMVFLVNIEPAFVMDKFHENSAQLAHLRYYSFAKEKNWEGFVNKVRGWCGKALHTLCGCTGSTPVVL